MSKLKRLEELVPVLPKHSRSYTGKLREPINLIFLGNKSHIEKSLRAHGWVKAHPITITSIIRTFWATALNRNYPAGPISPSYIGKKHFLIGFEHATHKATFKRRHHLRLWRTPLKIGKSHVWVGTISYDRTVGVYSVLIPTHHISPSLIWEETFLAHSLGITKPDFLHINNPEVGKLNNGDDYIYDGRALVIDFTN